MRIDQDAAQRTDVKSKDSGVTYRFSSAKEFFEAKKQKALSGSTAADFYIIAVSNFAESEWSKELDEPVVCWCNPGYGDLCNAQRYRTRDEAREAMKLVSTADQKRFVVAKVTTLVEVL